MAADFAQNGFHFPAFLKTVMKSSAYKLSEPLRGRLETGLRRPTTRALVPISSSAELHDAIALATAGTAASGQKSPHGY